MDINKMFPSKWLRAADIDDMADEETQTASVTVDRIVMEEVGSEGQEKPIVYFRGVDAGLVLNKTNANTIGQLHGNSTDGWVGKSIGLFTTEVDFQGKQVLSIRVRLKQPKKGKPVKAEELFDTDSIPF